MPQVHRTVEYTDGAATQLIPAQRGSAAVAPVTHRSDAWSKISYTCIRNLSIPLLRAVWRPTVEGLENIPDRGGAILASNHLSVLDSIFLVTAIERRLTFLAKSEYFSTPGLRGQLGRIFVSATGQISVDRSNRRMATAALNAGKGVVDRGELLAIYPEGTRSPDGRLYRGKHGVARLALETGIPVIPIGILGTYEVLPKHRRMPKPGRVQLRIGPPLRFPRTPGDRTGVAQRAATEQIMQSIGELSGQRMADQHAERYKGTLTTVGGQGR